MERPTEVHEKQSLTKYFEILIFYFSNDSQVIL